MNYFKEAEKVLSNRKDLDRSLLNLYRRKDRLIDSGAPTQISGIDMGKPYVSGGLINDTMTDCLDLIEVQKEITITEAKIKEVDDIIAQLQPENKMILSKWYIENKTKDQLLTEFHCSSFSTLYDSRNKAIGKFAVLYFGASALDAI